MALSALLSPNIKTGCPNVLTLCKGYFSIQSTLKEKYGLHVTEKALHTKLKPEEEAGTFLGTTKEEI